MAELRVGPIRLMGWYFGWLAYILPETTLYQFLRMLEVPAIIVALAAFGIDYLDRGTDRATRRAQLLAQVAELATIKHPNASGGIKAILEFLADEDVSMRGIALEITELSGVDLEGAHLRSANLTGANLTGADLTAADLTAADLISADLISANLTGADLTAADLISANLTAADLISANLTGADLTAADLISANLTGANLTGADLTAADLTSTNVTREQLDSACISKGGKPPTLPEGLKPPHVDCATLTR